MYSTIFLNHDRRIMFFHNFCTQSHRSSQIFTTRIYDSRISSALLPSSPFLNPTSFSMTRCTSRHISQFSFVFESDSPRVKCKHSIACLVPGATVMWLADPFGRAFLFLNDGFASQVPLGIFKASSRKQNEYDVGFCMRVWKMSMRWC